MSTLALLFDFDGTLVDSSTIDRLALKEVWRQLGLPGRPPQEFRDMEGIPLQEQLRRLCGQHAQEAETVFVAFYRSHHTRLLKPFPGVRATLARLRREGHWLGVISNKRRAAALPELQSLALSPLLDAAYFLEDLQCPKPDGRSLHHILETHRLEPACTWLVGDSPLDIRFARDAGITSVAALWGSRHPEALLEAAPDLVCPRVAHLVPLVHNMVARRFILHV